MFFLDKKRFFEILPGFCVWLTFIVLIFLSFKKSVWVVVFIILYDFYWILKIFYLYFYLYFSFRRFRKNLKINWLEKLQKELADSWLEVYHLIIFPMYQEPYEVVKRSFESLLEVNYPKDKLILVLAIEERGGIVDQETASKIEKEFKNNFFQFLVTIHPKDLPNEIPGKGSNESFALRQAKEKIVDELKISYERIIVSSFDIDTRPGPDYFAILTYKFLTEKDGQFASYQPIPLFLNNFHRATPFSRIIGFTSSFWQFMQQARSHRMVSFSSHSIPFKGLVEVGYWPVDIVSEDSQIFFVLYNHFNGRWRVVPLHYPVYMDVVVGQNFFEELKNLYKQQRRWAWGVENWVYLACVLPKNKNISFKQKFFWLFNVFTGFYSWATSSLIILIFGWLPNVVGGEVFKTTVVSYNLPRFTGLILNFSILGVITSAYLSILLLSPEKPKFKKSNLIYFLQWFLMPLNLIFFGSLPALEALTRKMLGGRFRLDFWRTPKGS